MGRLVRDWGPARQKVEEEGQCRRCGGINYVQAAHVIGRARDVRVGNKAVVNKNSVIPLCDRCHRLYDAHQISIRALLTDVEWEQAIEDAGGEGLAERRVHGKHWRTTTVTARPTAKSESSGSTIVTGFDF